jgi:acyl carrier protein
MSQDTIQRVSRIIADYREIPIETVEPESRLVEDLGLDSLGYLEIVFEIEEEFQVRVLEEDAFEFTTIGAVCEGVDALVRSSEQASVDKPAP